MKTLTALALILLSYFAYSQDAKTLGELKQKYRFHRVVVIGPVSNLDHPPTLLDWSVATIDGGRFVTDLGQHLPATYRGKIAMVVGIQLDDPKSATGTNAMGEAINPDTITNPYFDIIVRFDDEHLAMTAAYPNSIGERLKLSAVQNAEGQEMATELPGVVGSKLFASGLTEIFSTDATLQELLGPSRILKQVKGVPFLVPLTVEAAKYNELEDRVILKLKLPDGREALSVSNPDTPGTEGGAFLSRVAGTLLTEIPKNLTQRELSAIKKQQVYKGMDRMTLYYALGNPKTENDWGQGGKQFVYTDQFIVYLDRRDKVVDWQSLGR